MSEAYQPMEPELKLRGEVAPRRIALGSVSATLAIVMISLLVQSAFWAALPERWRVRDNTDYAWFYEPVGQSIASGHGIFRTDGTPAIRYPPGYPGILAVLILTADALHVPAPAVIGAFAMLCSSAAAVFIFKIAESTWGSPSGWIATLAWIFYPLGLWYGKEPGSELPFVAAMTGAFCLLWTALMRRSTSGSAYFLSGIVIGFAMLIRPIAIGAGVLMAAIVWIASTEIKSRTRAYLVCLVILGNVAAVAPWELWIFQNTGRFELLSTGGVPSILDGLSYGVNASYRGVGSTPPDVVELMEDVHAQGDTVTSLGQVRQLLSAQLAIRPAAVVKLFALKIGRSWYGTDSQRMETSLMLVQGAILLVIVVAAVLAWMGGGAPRALSIAVTVFLLYFWAMTVVVLSTARYTMPAVALSFAILPAAFIRRPPGRDRARARRSRTVCGSDDLSYAASVQTE